MNWRILAFVVLSVIILPLAAYNLAVLTTGYTAGQQDVVNYVYYSGTLQGNFTSAEASHLEDVKSVMTASNIVFISALIALLFLGVYMYKTKELENGLFYGGIASGASVLFFGIVGLLSWDYLFDVFHSIFFPQGNWMFASDSLIITLFPGEFFVLVAGKILIFTLFLSGMSIIIGRMLVKKK